MLLADFLYGIGAILFLGAVTFIAMVWWECHCEARQERHKARLTDQWMTGLPARDRDQ